MSEKKQIQAAILRHFKKKNKFEKQQRAAKEFREGAMRLSDALAAEEKFFNDERWRKTMSQ
ncbi:MAG: hypothetical protein WCX77_04145 [Candidatus Paceibacterota bacterium]|jgi:hypothetical protein